MCTSQITARRALSATLAAALTCTLGCSAVNSSAPGQTSANTYAYVLEENGLAQTYSVAQFQMSSSGELTALTPASVSVPAYTGGLASDRSGKFVFAETGQASWITPTIDQFVVGSDGSLTPNAVPTIDSGKGPGPMAFTPNGKFAIVTNYADGTATSYSIGDSGALSVVNTVPAGIQPYNVVVDGTGQYVLIATSTGNSPLVSEYSMAQDGTLALMNSFPIAQYATSMVVSPKGLLYYIEDILPQYGTGPGSVIIFSINPTGGGVSILSNSATPDSSPGAITFDPSGSFAYMGNGNLGTLSQYTVDANTGALTKNGDDLTDVRGYGIVDPSGKFFFLMKGVTSTPAEITQLVINPDGTLSPNGSLPLGTGMYPYAIAFAQH